MIIGYEVELIVFRVLCKDLPHFTEVEFAIF